MGEKGSLQQKDKLWVFKSQCLPPRTAHYHHMLHWQWGQLELTLLLLEELGRKGAEFHLVISNSFCAWLNESLQCQDKNVCFTENSFANDCLLPASISRQSSLGRLDLHAYCNIIVQLPLLHRCANRQYGLVGKHMCCETDCLFSILHSDLGN